MRLQLSCELQRAERENRDAIHQHPPGFQTARVWLDPEKFLSKTPPFFVSG